VAVRPVFHITHVENLKSIAAVGLLCDEDMDEEQIEFRSIAYQNIKVQRAATEVPIEPYGTLADYVPFYFAPRSPMLFTISRGNVAGAEGQQGNIVR